MKWLERMGFARNDGSRRRANRRRRASMLMVRARATEHRRAWRSRIRASAVVVLALAALAGGLLLGTRRVGQLLFTDNARFAITRIEVSSDGRLSERHILEYARLQPGENLFALSLEDVRRRLESVPVVRRVELQRRLPGTLVVRVQERAALAALPLAGSGTPLAVDAEGYILGPGSHVPSLPLLTGLGAAALRPGQRLEGLPVHEALAVAELCSKPPLSGHLRVRGIGIEHPRHLELRLAGGERVLLGRDRPEWRLRSVAAVLDACRNMNRRVAVIDATGDRNFPVEYR